jgi:iron complex outermembrane receptor protein
VVNVLDGLIAEAKPEAPLSGDAFGAYNSVNEGAEGALRLGAVTGPFVVNLTASGRDLGDFDIPGRAEAFEDAHDDEEDHDHDHEEESEGTVPNSFLTTQTRGAGVSLVGDRGFIGVSARSTISKYGLLGHSHGHDEESEEEENPFIDLEQTRFDLRAALRFNGAFLNGMRAAKTRADYTHTEFEAPGEAGTVFDSEGIEARVDFDYTAGCWKGATGLQAVDSLLSAQGDEAFITPTESSLLGAFLYQAREWDSGFGVETGARLERVTRTNIGGGNARFNLLSGSLGVLRHLGSGWFLGAQVSRTRRAPNASAPFANGLHLATAQSEVGNNELKRETGTNLELVARWTGERSRVSFNLFATDNREFIALVPGTIILDGEVADEADDLPVFLFVQDDAQFIGGEISTATRFDGGLFGADWTLGAQLDFVSGELDTRGDVPLLPPLTLGLSADADWAGLNLGATVTLAADQYEPGTGRSPTDGFTRIDVRSAWTLPWATHGGGDVTLFAAIPNLTDEEARTATSVLKDLVPQPGRNIRAGLRVTFSGRIEGTKSRSSSQT